MSKKGLWRLVAIGLLVSVAFVGLVVLSAWVVTEEPLVPSPSLLEGGYNPRPLDSWQEDFEAEVQANANKVERGTIINKRFAQALDGVAVILAVALAAIPAALAVGLAWRVFRWASGA